MVTTKELINRDEWENFVKTHEEANFLHSWHWGAFHEKIGNKIYRMGFFKNEKLIGVMLVIVESAKRGRYLTISGGPIINWDNGEIVELWNSEVKNIAKKEQCVFVRVRPQLIDNEISRIIFKNNGFIDAPMHLHAELTSQLDITQTEEQLLAGMRKTTRYEIKRGLSQDIKIETSTDPAEMKAFYDLQIQTAQRQGFVPFSYDFLHEQFAIFAKENCTLLYSAKKDGQLLAQAFVIFYGEEAIYHYGASTSEGRKYPGAYLIQWEAIREAKKRGMKRYNFWGVAPENETPHRFYGVSVFKRGFGGKDISYLHAQDLVINKPRYLVNWIIETVRKNVRRV